MITPTNKMTTVVSHLTSLRSLITIGFFFLINIAAAQEWTLVTRKGNTYPKADLEIIKILYKNNGFELVNRMMNDSLYFGKGNKVLLTSTDHDKENNCVRLEMNSSTWGNNVSDRWIYYLDRDGPSFMKFLFDLNKFEGLSMDDIKRVSPGQDNTVVGYTVKLMKARAVYDAAAKIDLGLNLFSIDRIASLKVHMRPGGNKIKYFEFLGQCSFVITSITNYDEENNRILIKTGKTPHHGIFDVMPADRWLYLDDNSDSKRFLFFLAEHYLFNDDRRFTTHADAAVRLYIENQRTAVMEWTTETKPTYGLTNPTNAGEFLKRRRRRVLHRLLDGCVSARYNSVQ